MRTVICPGLDRNVSALGFGCGSLGSRLSNSQSRRILDFAFERGIDWYDVAPPDGDGEAETILGHFFAGRREKVVISAKIGAARPALSPIMHLIGTIKRSALNAFPELSAISFGKGKLAKEKEPLRPELIESSVVESLRRMRTDHIDVLALRDPTREDCANPAIFDALRRVLDKGYVRSLAIAGDPDAIEAARARARFSIIQFCNNPFHRTVERIRAMSPGDDMEFFDFFSLRSAAGLTSVCRISWLAMAAVSPRLPRSSPTGRRL